MLNQDMMQEKDTLTDKENEAEEHQKGVNLQDGNKNSEQNVNFAVKERAIKRECYIENAKWIVGIILNALTIMQQPNE